MKTAEIVILEKIKELRHDLCRECERRSELDDLLLVRNSLIYCERLLTAIIDKGQSNANT